MLTVQLVTKLNCYSSFKITSYSPSVVVKGGETIRETYKSDIDMYRRIK